jgi:hypothetical protein
MPSMIPMRAVRVQRQVNGSRQNVTPPIGKPFDFTDEEVKQLRNHPNHLRHPKNEAAEKELIVGTHVGPNAYSDKPVVQRIPDVETRAGQVVPDKVSNAPIPAVKKPTPVATSTEDL